MTVTTRYLPERNVVQIEIRDTGPGIAADQMDKLFSPFVSTKKSRGTGLGLPVSQKISDGARRQDHRREPSRSGGVLHAGTARREPRHDDAGHRAAGLAALRYASTLAKILVDPAGLRDSSVNRQKLA